MKIRVLSLLFSLVLIFGLFGCNFAKQDSADSTDKVSEETTVVQTIDADEYDTVDLSLVDFRTSLYSGVKLNKGYESLKTEEQKNCYELIESNIAYVSKEKTESYYPIAPITMNNTELSEAQLHLVITAFTMDNPQIFWIDSKFAYQKSDSATTVYLNSSMSAGEISEDAQKMGLAIEEIFAGIDSGLSEYERELQIHDAFAERCDYADNTDDFRVYTALGGLVDNFAVCEGYSRSMQILLSMAGIETYYVFGTGSEELHMWNVVNIDGGWYHLDTTWDDTDYGISYSYFNLTEEEITDDHTISPYYWELTEEEICGGDSGRAICFNIYIPLSNGISTGYYRSKAVEVTGFDEENIANIATAFINALDVGEEFIYLYINPDSLVYESALDDLFDNTDPVIFKSIEKANEQIYYTQINDEHIEIEEIPGEYIVCVYFEQA